jgi:fructose-1,6-bisphosphatase/inositol monophosphatase family enzyme
MVALVRRKKTVAAWIHDPSSGHTLSAEEGSGVWLQGHKMRLAGADPALPKVIIMGWHVKDVLCRPEAASVVAALPALSLGSAAAFDYARLFTGDILFANSTSPRASFLLYRVTKPWDHMPGLFLHAEAKGYSADFDGHPYDTKNEKNGLILAPDEDAWLEIHKTIKPILPGFARVDSL